MDFSHQDVSCMQRAIQLAEEAARQREVPVGAVLILNGQIIGEGNNSSIRQCDPTAHAEIVALRNAGCQQKNYRLPNSTLYVTLEPCMMCLGALIHARIKKIIFGAHDPKSGALASLFKIENTYQLNHRIEFKSGLLADSCGVLLQEFFKERRSKKRSLVHLSSYEER